MNGGFSAHNNGTSASFDYLVIVGNIAYNAAQTSAVCTSGISLYQPKASDTINSGTHMFIAGNLSYGNRNPDPCAGTAPTDGEGVILDTFDFSSRRRHALHRANGGREQSPGRQLWAGHPSQQ